MTPIETIVWDWNGTLIDDIDLCIVSINQLLAIRRLPTIGREMYLEVFGFPVQEYYERIGFNFSIEPFEVPANQFIELYSAGVGQCQLHDGAKNILEHFRSEGKQQIILSAMEQSKLEKSVQQLGIRGYFEAIAGLNHDYATSKEEIGVELFRNHHIDPAQTLLIGDTLHDAEVATKLGCRSVLVSIGHQSQQRLSQKHQWVVNSLSNLKGLNLKN